MCVYFASGINDSANYNSSRKKLFLYNQQKCKEVPILKNVIIQNAHFTGLVDAILCFLNNY